LPGALIIPRPRSQTGYRGMTRLFRYCLFLALVTFVAVSQNTRDSLAAHWLYAGLAGSVASFSNVGSLDDWWTFANGCAARPPPPSQS
jgi:hypothetical protein